MTNLNPVESPAAPCCCFDRMIVVSVLAVLATLTGAARAQMPAIPSDEHFRSFDPYLGGDFTTAARYFASSSRIKSTQGVWIDSIAFHAMTGECFYHMGDLTNALQQYTAALQVYLTHSDWMSRMEFPATLQPSARSVRKPPTWGVSKRPIRIAQIPDRIATLQGSSNSAMDALKHGGVVTRPQYVMINAKEIVRCTALAIRRRAEIMGVACEHDSLTSQLITALSRRPAPAGNWSQAWVSAQLGLAYAAKGKTAEAVTQLNQSLLVGGMDHLLTSTSLLELGKLAFRANDYAAAGNYFLEATYSAAYLSQDDYTQYEVLAEAFRWAMVSFLASGQKSFFQPVLAAATWSRRGPRILESSLLLSAAESYAAINDSDRAAGMLDAAMTVLRRRECLNGALGARLQFITAQVGYQRGDVKRGAAALATALHYEKAGGSTRLFQIALIDNLFTSGSVTSRQAGVLFADVLRDPTPLDWVMDPLESLAILTTPHEPAFEHWMLLAIDRNEGDDALRIGDQLRRHRFYSSLPLGGRVLNLRWALEAADDAISPNIVLQRRALQARFPGYSQLSLQASQIRTELKALPPVPEDQDQLRNQSNLLKKLGQLSATQEAMLASMALSREPSEAVFPPSTDITVVQQQLAPKQRVLVFISTRTAAFAFLLGTEKYSTWRLASPTKIKANIATMLRGMGQYDANQPIDLKELTSDVWKDAAAEILKDLTGNAPASAWDEFDELIIVPDGQLWYVPFEALRVQNGDARESLIDKVRIRYVPTVSLAVPDNRPRARIARTAVVAGSIFPRADETVSEELFEELSADDPQVFRVPVKPVPPSALFSTTLDRMLVLDDLENSADGPYDWAPMGLDRGQATGSLAQWMALPWGGPDQIVLPGFHTAAESGLKRSGTGNEVFLAVCGLMSTGARTILLSRWRDGGRTSYDLVREFARELPHRSACQAWQRSVRLAVNTELDVAQEPRVKPLPTDTSLEAKHPFFWSGYMLIDTGVEPK